jgi:thioredoxin-related protein
MIYFHQNGCPYCAKLVKDNFHDKKLVAKLQKDFDVIEINMWGDTTLSDWTGKTWMKDIKKILEIQCACVDCSPKVKPMQIWG